MAPTIVEQVQPKHRQEAAKVLAHRMTNAWGDYVDWNDPQAQLVARSLDEKGPYTVEINILAAALAEVDQYSEVPF